jgi:hypothetical protein
MNNTQENEILLRTLNAGDTIEERHRLVYGHLSRVDHLDYLVERGLDGQRPG